VIHETSVGHSRVAFDYRRADPSFSVWGWSLNADPRRAAEFLDIRGASRHGLTLTGSGTTTVTTTSYFAPGRDIILQGARVRSARADRVGRITFTVDLGPPHRNQEYTLQAALAGESRPGYFTTRKVVCDPVATSSPFP
jgi:hypothetical protein